MKVIAFAGLARAGKTTAAKMASKWCIANGYNPVIMSFAEPMKRAAARIGLSKDDDPEKYRSVLQRWGSTRRDPEYKPGVTGPDYWVNRMLMELVEAKVNEKDLYRSCDNLNATSIFSETVVIFDDCRYLNEVEMIGVINGIVVFVDGISRISDPLAQWRQHESEMMAWAYTFGQLPDDVFDYYVINDKTQATLQKKINKMMPKWMEVCTT